MKPRRGPGMTPPTLTVNVNVNVNADYFTTSNGEGGAAWAK